MKKILLLLLIFTIAIPLFAQKNTNDEEIQTIFGDGEFTSGGYGSPEIKYTQFLDENALMVGGRGGWIINHTFSIGGAGYGLVTSHPVYYDSNYNEQNYLRVGWGGVFLQYTNSSNKLVHFTVNSLIGAGFSACMPSFNQMDNNRGNMNSDFGGSGFFIFEPGIGVELNVLKFFRVELGGSYRIIAGLDMPVNPDTNIPYVVKSDMGNWSVNLAFKFGEF